jgi:transposase-like protein
VFTGNFLESFESGYGTASYVRHSANCAEHAKQYIIMEMWSGYCSLRRQTMSFEGEAVLICPYCKSYRIIKRGVRRNKTGTKQRYSCKDCGKKFVLNPWLSELRQKLSPIILQLRERKYTLREIQEIIEVTTGIKISYNTINNWIIGVKNKILEDERSEADE